MTKILTFYLRQSICGSAVLILNACGATGFDTSQMLSIQIQGVHKAPDGAVGDSAPKKIVVNFVGLKLIHEDGSQVDLSPAEAQEVEIINRPEIFFQADLSDYDGISFNGVQIDFNADVEITGRYKIRPMTLTSSSFSVLENFTVAASQGQLVKIDVHWLNTAYTDADAYDEVFTEPSFVTSIEND